MTHFGFSTLPREILALILTGPDVSPAVFLLMQSGDRILLAKLPSSITHIDLARSASSRVRPPITLSGFTSLRRLALKSTRNFFKERSDWHQVLPTLPQSLEELSINSPDAIFAFVDPAPPPEDHEYPRGKSDWIDISKLFPRLTTLVLLKSLAFNLNNLAALPSTITHLGFSYLKIDLRSMSSISAFPPSLRILDTALELDCREFNEFGARLSAACPHLEVIKQLQIYSLEEAGSDARHWLEPGLVEDFQWLPRTLLSLALSSLTGDFKFNSVLTRSLPPNLHTIKCPLVHPTFFLDLPCTNLREIRFSEGTFGADLEYLPRTLEIFDANPIKFDWTAIEPRMAAKGATFWPPNLTSLRRLADLKQWHLPLLPKSLTDFVLSTAIDHLELVGDLLPPKLVNLSIQRDRFAQVHVSISGSLPHSLTSFKLSSEQLNRSTLEKLPSSITSLTLNSTFDLDYMEAENIDPWKLPTRLLQFDASCWPAGWVSALPKTITSLQIDCLIGTPATIYLENRLFRDCPPNLESLIIEEFLHQESWDYAMKDVEFSEDCLLHLPQLHKLRVRASFPSTLLRHLPKRLRVLDVDLESLEREDVQCLPPTMICCILQLTSNATHSNNDMPLCSLSDGQARDRHFKLDASYPIINKRS